MTIKEKIYRVLILSQSLVLVQPKTIIAKLTNPTTPILTYPGAITALPALVTIGTVVGCAPVPAAAVVVLCAPAPPPTTGGEEATPPPPTAGAEYDVPPAFPFPFPFPLPPLALVAVVAADGLLLPTPPTPGAEYGAPPALPFPFPFPLPLPTTIGFPPPPEETIVAVDEAAGATPVGEDTATTETAIVFVCTLPTGQFITSGAHDVIIWRIVV